MKPFCGILILGLAATFALEGCAELTGRAPAGPGTGTSAHERMAPEATTATRPVVAA